METRNHDTSVPTRQRGRTQKRAAHLRPLVSELARERERDRERAFETYRALTGSNLNRLADLPGIPSPSRISHLRNDEENFIHQGDDLIRAKLQVGDPVEECGLVLVHFADTIERTLASNPVPLPIAMVSAARYDAEQDIAAAETFASEYSDRALDEYIATMRRQLSSGRVALTAALLERDRRREAAA